jgi:hypothetical protein
MELEGSLPCSQEPSNGLYPEDDLFCNDTLLVNVSAVYVLLTVTCDRIDVHVPFY